MLRDDTSVPGMRWIQVEPMGGTTALTLATWFDSMPSGSTQGLVLATDDIEADHAALVAKGATSTAHPPPQLYGVETVLRDPDGNRLVLLQRN